MTGPVRMKPGAPGVTVIIPNYNGAGDITACLDRLKTQTYPADVILLNNDAFAEKTFSETLVRAIRRKKNTFAVQAMMLQADDPGNHIDSSGDCFYALGWAFSPGRDQNAAYYADRVRITSACAGAAHIRRDALLALELLGNCVRRVKG